MKIKKTKYLLNTLGFMIGLWQGSCQATILWSEGVTDEQRQTSLSLSSYIEGVSPEWRVWPAKDMKDVYRLIGRPSHLSSLQPQQFSHEECSDIRAALQKEADTEKENYPTGFFSQEDLEVQAIDAVFNDLKCREEVFCLDLIPQKEINLFFEDVGIPSILLTAGKGFQFDSPFMPSEDSKAWQWVVFATPSGDTLEDAQLELLHTILKKENLFFKEVIKGDSFQTGNPNAREGAVKRIQEMLEKMVPSRRP